MILLRIYNDNKRGPSSGFSLLEIIIVIAIVAVVASFGASFSMNSISRSSLLSERDLLVSLLTQARAESLANVNESAHSVYIDTDSYVLYEGATYDVGNATNRVVPKVSSAAITGIDTVTFEQLTANVASAGIMTVEGDAQSYDIEVNSVGRINW